MPQDTVSLAISPRSRAALHSGAPSPTCPGRVKKARTPASNNVVTTKRAPWCVAVCESTPGFSGSRSEAGESSSPRSPSCGMAIGAVGAAHRLCCLESCTISRQWPGT